ncbi:MAG: alpha/beta fold hydrolase [Pseudomonadota bacterium]
MHSYRSIAIAGRDVTFLQEGPPDTPRVVLLHGGGFDNAALSWRMLLPKLMPDYAVIAPNWPGIGGSTAFGRPYSVSDLGEWLIRLLDTKGIDKAGFVGVSMGGAASLWMAANHPDRVSALVPVATHGVTPTVPYHFLSHLLMKLPINALSYSVMRRSRKALRAMMSSIFADPTKLTDELVEEAQEAIADAGAGEAFTHFQRGESTPSGLRTDLRGALAAMPQPALFIHGTKDPLIPLASVRQAASTMPNAKLAVLDAGHWPMRERPQEFNALVASFLQGVRSRSTIS